MMYDTLLLDQIEWDLVLDAAGNIAKASPPYSLAQDVASAIRLFLGELFYDTTKGVPYQTKILGQLPPAALLVAFLNNAAKTVPGVVTVQTVLTSFNDREVTGQVQFTDESGAAHVVTF